MPEYQKVKSSIIDRIAWEDGNLYVRFLNGSLYVFYSVPENVFVELQNVSSKGNFFYQNIRNSYEYNKLY